MPHQVRHDIWAGGWGKRGVAGRRQSPAVGVAEDPARGRDWILRRFTPQDDSLVGAGARGSLPPLLKIYPFFRISSISARLR